MVPLKRAGFTLIELLVVMAVLLVLSALLFPVMRLGLDAARRTHCIQNYRQIGAALVMYQSDYEDRVPPVNYTAAFLGGYFNGDRTWVQTLLPYVGHFAPFMCPADYGRDKVPGPPPVPSARGDPWNRYYLQSLRSNLGYNYLYFSPLLYMHDDRWVPFPIRASDVRNPSRSIVFIDSLWDRTNAGMPYGGGSWVIVPPCRYADVEGRVMDTFKFTAGARFYFGFQPEGWQPESTQSWLVYGGAWPWHRHRFTVMYFDGRVETLEAGQLIEGCNFHPGWEGLIKSLEDYRWDIME